jgi:uncharacterized protein DUF5990
MAKRVAGSSVVLRITGTELPGRSCGASGDFPGYDNIHVAVQRKDRPGELLDPQPADLERVSWTLPCTAVPGPDGPVLNGPYIQNRQGKRFIYVSWVTVDEQGAARLFRRGKVLLSEIDPGLLAEAVEHGRLHLRLTLTDAKGNPNCARLVAPHVQWSAPSTA